MFKTGLKLFGVLSLTILLSVSLIACGGDGGDDDDGGNGDAGTTYTASGTYTYDSDTGVVVLNITNSDFSDDYTPVVGTMQVTVLSLTGTTMITEDEDGQMTWTRDSGTSGDPVGTWEYYDSDEHIEMTLGADGSFSLTLEVLDNGDAGTTYTSSGTYTYDPDTGHLVVNTTTVDFPDAECAPEVGTDEFNIIYITTTTMLWEDLEDPDRRQMTWTRDSGTSGDIVGTWERYDSEYGYTEGTIESNNSFSTIGECP